MEDELSREAFAEPPTAIDIDGDVGTTRVYGWQGSGEPLVLLHGMGGTGLMWAPLLPALGDHTIYAIDQMGDVGRSVHRVGFRDADHLATWLDSVLQALELPRAHLVGNSYGAFVALNQALRAPGRVASISLLDPGGLAPLSPRFFLWGAKVFAAAYLPTRLRLRAATRLRMPLLEDRRINRMIFFGQRHHRFRVPFPTPLDDAQLRAIAAPTLLLIGAESEIYRPAKALARAQAIPNLDATIIPDVGHALPIDPKADAGGRIARFVERWAGEPRVGGGDHEGPATRTRRAEGAQPATG